jgi:small subunit ribosomal protein S17e
MGRVSNKVVKRAAKQIVEKQYSRLTLDFYHNRSIIADVAEIPSKTLRNKVSGYATRLMKRIRYGKVKGISIKIQEEERERRENYVPTESIVDLERIEVDPVSMAMVEASGATEGYFVAES